MATNQIKTRILNKIDTYSNWIATGAIVLKKGEIGIATITTPESAAGMTPPAVGIKVGDGTTPYKDLPWIQAVAGDVTSYIKDNLKDKETFDTQVRNSTGFTVATADTLDKILNDLKTAINNESSDSSTRLKALEDEVFTSTTKSNQKLYEAVTSLNTNKADKTQVVTDINTAKTTLIGASSDATTADTIWAAKNSAAAVQANLDKVVSDRIVPAESSIINHGNRLDTAEGEIDTLQSDVKEIQDIIGDSTTGNTLVSRISALETTSGEHTETLEDHEERIVALEGTTSTHTTQIGTINETLTSHGTTLTNHGDRITTAEGKLTTLIASDSGKSVRTIANEELAKQLIPEGAIESLDTLKEIADWIQAHPADVAEMNSAISKNAEDIATNAKAIEKNAGDIATNVENITKNATAISNLASRHDDEMTAVENRATTLESRATAIESAATALEKKVDDNKTATDKEIASIKETATSNLAEAKAYTNTQITTLATNRIDNIVGSSVAEADGVISTISFSSDKITATRKKVDMNDMDDSITFVFYCGSASEVQ